MKKSAHLYKWLIASLLIICSSTALLQAQPSNSTLTGLVSWWKAESNGLDSVGGNTAYAALLPGGTAFAPGEVGQAFQLNDINAYLVVPASPSLNVGTGNGVTMEGWIKVSSVVGLHPIVEWDGDVRDTVGVQIWLNSWAGLSGGLFGVVVDSDTKAQHRLLSPQGLVQPNVFQHVALTYDKASGIAALYLNGAVVAQDNIGTFEPLTSGNLWMGHRPFDVPGDITYGTSLGGLLDEFSIYNRALASNEIADIYNADSAGKSGITNSGIAPAITKQPTNQTVTAGGTATFSATVTGTAPLYYQWYGPTNNLIQGALTSTLTLSNVQSAKAGSYFVVATNSFGSASSTNAVLTVTGGSGGGTNSCTPPPSGIVAWWRAEGNANDSINGNNGTVMPGATNAPGKVGLGFLLDGNGYIAVPASSNLDIGTANGLTIEGWINETDYNAYGGEPIIEWDSETADGLQLFAETGLRLYANLKDTSGNNHQIIEDTGTLTTNAFQHVALTYDKSSGIARLYVNGAEVKNENFGNITPQTTYPLNIGARTFYGWGNRFSGIIDELSLYRRALSSNEIATIYNAGSAGKCSETNSGTGTAAAITHQPTNQTVTAGGTATFSVTATGTAPLYYQWSGPAGSISGATHSSLTLSNVQPAQSGNYFVVVSNAYGTATSSNALLTVTSGGGETNSCTPPAANIAAWWPAEGNGTDIIGGNTATPQGGATYAPGEVGQAFLLNGANDYLSVPASSNLNVAADGSLTAEAWIKVSDVAGYHPIVEWNDGLGHGGVHMWILPYTGESAGVLFANVVDTGGGSHSFHSPGGSVTTDVFQHVALTYDQPSGMGTLYVNGNIVAQEFIGQFAPQTSYPFWLGHRPNVASTEPDYGSSLGGLLDEPALYRRALSPSEIAAIYNAGVNGKCGHPPLGIAPALTHQPTNQTVTAGGTATFSVTATGTAPLYYQWSGPAGSISGATTASLVLSNVQPAQSGNYFVVVSNGLGAATSSNALLTVIGNNANCTPPATNIAAWWPAEGNGTDIIGGNTATLQGGATFAPGKVGQAFLLNGANDYLSVPASSNLNVAAGGSLTAEAWIKVSDVAGYHPIVEWNDGLGHGGVHMWILPYTGESDGVLFANVVDTGGGSHSFHSPGGSVTTNVFQHVALTYDGSSGMGTLYVNGSIVAQEFIGQFAPQTSYPFWLGHRPNIPLGEVDYGSSLGGLLDEPALYSRALSPSEIAAIYNAGADGKCAPQAPLTPHSLINPQPTINMSVAGNSPSLSWPLSAGDFTLQAADSLTPPIRWTNVPITLQTNGNNIEVTLPEGGEKGYFRLYRP